jgi:hypothetical protein
MINITYTKMEFTNTLFSYNFDKAKELYNTESKLYINEYCDGGYELGVDYKMNELMIKTWYHWCLSIDDK